MFSRHKIVCALVCTASISLGYFGRYWQETTAIDIALERRAISAIERKWPVSLSKNIGLLGEYKVKQIDIDQEYCIIFSLSGFMQYGNSFLYCEDVIGNVRRLSTF